MDLLGFMVIGILCGVVLTILFTEVRAKPIRQRAVRNTTLRIASNTANFKLYVREARNARRQVEDSENSPNTMLPIRDIEIPDTIGPGAEHSLLLLSTIDGVELCADVGVGIMHATLPSGQSETFSLALVQHTFYSFMKDHFIATIPANRSRM